MVELRPHQVKALEKLSNGKILMGDVGTGKSMVSAAYYMKEEAPKDVYVITTAKKRDSLDWRKEFVAFGVGTERDATTAGVLTVDSWNNIGRYADVRDAFFIFDEQRLVGSGAWTKSFLSIAKSNRWILLSATPGDTWLDYIPVFIANGFYKNRTEFKREHVVYNTYSKFPKVDRYIETGRLIKYRNAVLVDMPYERHTVRHCENVEVEYDKTLFEKVVKKRWHVYEDRPLRDVAELFSVMRKVVNSDSSRITELQKLSSLHPKLIVFYNFDYELEQLRSLKQWSDSRMVISPSTTGEQPKDSPLLGKTSPETSLKDESPPKRSSELEGSPSIVKTSTLSTSKVQESSQTMTNSVESESSEMTRDGDSTESWAIAEWNGHKHEPIPGTDRWVYLVQYAAGSEGWNCIDTDAMVFYSQTYSYKHFHQAHGRIDRLNTPYNSLYYYHFVSKSFIDQAILKALKGKKSFNEGKFREKY